MDIEVIQALIVLPMVVAEGGLFYLLARKFWKASRQEAGLMAIGLTLLFFVFSRGHAADKRPLAREAVIRPLTNQPELGAVYDLGTLCPRI
jgi:hypothetical protein